ncbi:MAG: cofactor-independent phosphoglycerate mutase [Candidatus Margulisiibacteriota bacterium]
MTKYLVLIGDGMSDLPLKALGGKTPLAAARTPNLDFLAQNGLCGWTNNIPRGLEPGSDVAAMSIFGNDPQKYYSGRGPLEAASLGIELKAGEVAFRCNLVTVEYGRMKDFTAHHIATPEARRILAKLNREIGSRGVKFYPGLSYRNLLVMTDSAAAPLEKIKTVPPHDITGQKINGYLPQGKGADQLLRLMNESEVILHGLTSRATMIWPWGQGKRPDLLSFRRRFGKKAAIITAVHLLKGLGKILGMEVINVPGATGYLDTNYRGKAAAALQALRRNDVVFVHVEAPDEAGHEGNVKHKIQAIEDFDKYVVGAMLKHVTRRACRQAGNALRDTRILVLPDHPTPIKYMTHTRDDVPFVIYPAPLAAGRQLIKGYSEREIGRSKFRVAAGHHLLEVLFHDR